jgi:phosphoribosylformylglycinamidine synthase
MDAEPTPEPQPVAADPIVADPIVIEPEPERVPAAVPVMASVDDYPDPLPPPNGWREVGFDTVLRAVATGHEHQPYHELGLQEDEYAKIRQILGRRPTESELAMYAIMWSEHCSYKSSKVHLRQFTEKAPPSDRCWPASARTLA